MESADTLIPEINRIKERHDRLLNRFDEFVAQIITVKDIDQRFDAIEIIDNGDHSINIHFLDKTLQARFTFFVAADDSRKGHVTCYKVTKYPEEKKDVIHSFSFNAQGETDIPITNHGGDPYELQERVDAVNILLHWVRLSVNHDS